MTGTPNLKSKTNRLTFIPLSKDEEQISLAFKKLVIQDETTQHDMILEAIQLLFVKHHLTIGGNPQRQLLSFQEPVVEVQKCRCGKPAIKHGIQLETKKEFCFCGKCFSDVPARHDVHIWSWKGPVPTVETRPTENPNKLGVNTP